MQHGVKNFEVTAPRSRFREGGFGRLFPDLEPWVPTKPDGTVPSSAAEMEALVMGIAKAKMTDAGAPSGDARLPAGYTYFGQFVDHDITLDMTPLSEAQADPNRLQNFRTPRLDLDSIYGLGPGGQPYLYQADGARFRIGKMVDGPNADLARLSVVEGEQQTALIGDPRNDENAIVAQVHLAFLLAHNALVDAGASFEAARRTLYWLYQWIVWNDYVFRITDEAVFSLALVMEPTADGRTAWKSHFDDVYNWRNKPFMPIEFSVAAYRFGHSLVRDSYNTNISKGFADADAITIFSRTDPHLGGFRRLMRERAVEWDWFLPMGSPAAKFPQRARKFDTKLSNALRHMREEKGHEGDDAFVANVLAARNILRGIRMELPSGTDVAKALNVAPIELEEDEPDALWFYILKEAEQGGGEHLGTVGSIIVAATFAGLLLGDKLSFFNIEPGWTPETDPLLARLDAERGLTGDEGKWTLASIIRLSGMPVSAAEF